MNIEAIRLEKVREIKSKLHSDFCLIVDLMHCYATLV